MDYALGIDVGTTFTAAAVYRDGSIEVFPLATYQVAVPSVIFADGDETLYAGAAERRGAAQPLGLAREFKRRLGDSVPLMLSGSPYHADRLTALMARWVVESVTTQVGSAPTQVVMTHPANWTEYQLGTLRNALNDVGLSATELISEPAAAALDFSAAANVEPGATVLVYDLGGGTFDVALLRREGDTFEHQIEPGGIERLGGIDFDEAVFQYVRGTVPPELLEAARHNPEGQAAIAQLRRRCVDAKEALSSDATSDIPVMLPGYTATIRITRAEFEGMIRPMIRQTMDVVESTLDRAHMEPGSLGAVLLVGGSSRIPLVPQMVAEQLGLPVRVDAHPKMVVAKGAARRAGTMKPRARRLARAQPATGPEAPRRRRLIVAAAVVLTSLAVTATWLATRRSSDPTVALDETTTQPALDTTPRPTSSPTSLPATTLPPTSLAGGTPPSTPVSDGLTFAETTQFTTRRQPVDLELMGTDLWVMSYGDGILQRFDTAAGGSDPVDEIDLLYHDNPSGNDIIRRGDLLYVTQYDGNTVALVDPATRQLVERIPMNRRPLNGTVLGDTVWLTTHPNEGTFDRGQLIPIDGTVVGQPFETEFEPGYILAVDDALWVTFDKADRIGRIDPTTGAADYIELRGEPVDLLAVGDDLWVTLSRRDRVAIVDRATMTVTGEVEIGPRPFKMIDALGSIWVTNHGEGATLSTVARLDRATGQPLQDAIPVGVGPLKLAASDDRVFVGNFGGGTVSVVAAAS